MPRGPSIRIKLFAEQCVAIAQFGKANRGVDEIAKNDFSSLHITSKKVLDSLAKERFAKAGIALYELSQFRLRPFLRHAKIQTTLDLYTQDDCDETRAAQGEYLTALGVATQTVQ